MEECVLIDNVDISSKSLSRNLSNSNLIMAEEDEDLTVSMGEYMKIDRYLRAESKYEDLRNSIKYPFYFWGGMFEDGECRYGL